MLRLNTDEIKNLQFEVVIQGINYDELTGSLKFIIEDVEYGIPVKIQKDLVSVEVPPLEEIVAQGMRDGDVVECKLDIFGNGFYLNPWDGQFELKTPVKMETTQLKLDNDPKSKKKRMKAVLKENKSDSKLDKEEILEMLFEKLADQGFNLKGPEPEYIEEDIEPKPIKKIKPRRRKAKPIVENRQPVKPKPRQLTREELVERKIKGKFSGINGLIKKVNSLVETKKVIRNTNSVAKQPVRESTDMSDIMQKVQDLKSGKKRKVEEEINLNPDDPIVLMESLGMRNPAMQQKMIDKAIELGGDGDKAVTSTLKKLLGVDQVNPYDNYQNIQNIKKD